MAQIDDDSDVLAGLVEPAAAEKRKGRGEGVDDERYIGRGGEFESLGHDGGSGPQRSVEGWIVFVTGVHEEAQEDDVLDKFAEYGDVKNINLNLDRRTGFVKGYALIEYAAKAEAEAAIAGMNGQTLLGAPVQVDWAFMNESKPAAAAAAAPRRGHEGRRRH